MPSAPDLEIILTNDHSRESFSSLNDGDDDMFLTIDTLDGDFPTIERPRTLEKKESLQSEKQVSVDPMSLMGSNIRHASFKLVSTPPRSPGHNLNFPSPLPPPKLKFVSSSLPSSTSSSPRSHLSMSKKPWEGVMAFPVCPQPHKHWGMDDTDLALQEINMRKSRSEGEGRVSSSADDFNIMPDRPSMGTSKYDAYSSFSKSETNYDDGRSRSAKQGDMPEDNFKCGKLCLFLPRGKGKAVRASSSNSISSLTSRMSSIQSHNKADRDRMPPVAPSHNKTDRISYTRSLKMDLPVISRRVSLERFDLGSLASSATSDDEGGEPTSLFFDLPLEMIRCSVSDMQSPVTTAFVFDKDANMESEPKGVLKNASPTNTDVRRRSMSQDPNRHVRFSTSSATSSDPCVSPTQKGRDDFNALLEAQRT